MLIETSIGILFASLTVTTVYQFIKKYVITWLDKQNPLVQQAFVTVLAAVVVPVFSYLNVTLPPDIHLWSSDVVNTMLSAIGAWGIHSLWKALRFERTL